MKILNNTEVLERQSDNYIKAELSNVSAVLSSPQVFVNYYSINANLSQTIPGSNTVESYVGEESTVVFDLIENLPMCGIGELLYSNEYDEESGYDESFESSAVILPNTIVPKPGDIFIIPGRRPVAYQVTDMTQTTARSNPYTQIEFKIWTVDKERMSEIDKQVKDNMLVTVTALGNDKTLVVNKAAYIEMKDHIDTYVSIVDMYCNLFYDKRKAAFIFKSESKISGVPDTFCDAVLWSMMFNTGTVIYDSVITYGINNYNYNVQRVYTDSPNNLIDQYDYRQSPFYAVLEDMKKDSFTNNRIAKFFYPSIQRSKYDGSNIAIVDKYTDTPESNNTTMGYSLWTTDFVDRLTANNPTGDNAIIDVLIAWYNGDDIDWDSVELSAERTIDNYYLIPMLLYVYKKHITTLQSK